ncbi:MGH1-like glycoside hydrolase domain-containing protein [Paenibacillus sp. LjRoot56]|uniref:MGH1-like glycoside hydrolase domain-containing protein n=1 Tax=Paenibacillus sp. LjRoot56 TaxID=3342333 RepID=UPI003ECE0366
MSENMINRLRGISVEAQLGELKKATDHDVLKEWLGTGVKFASTGGRLEETYYNGLSKLFDCIVPTMGDAPVLHEGGIYLGCWMESTGTINNELLSRFLPSVSEDTFQLFADYQKEDGQLPYKVTENGPAFRQIQMVTPLARSVWNHYVLNGRNQTFLRKMYEAMVRHDGWLATYRDTRQTGCVEAFCTFDTGHDLSPRFWHVPDSAHLDDARQYNPDSPTLPFLAPDLTANVYCQRLYLSRMAQELGDEQTAGEWNAKAEMSLNSLFVHCFDKEDAFFYDVDRNDEWVRVQSDVLLRVLACEVGDGDFFAASLRKYLLNTSKFFAKYPFTSVAMDDPRFDPFSSYNTWAGTSNFLSLIRTPHAFEHHHRYVELTWVLNPIVTALAQMTRFAQTVSPWTGKEGYTESYSPAILCLLDFVERMCGIVPRPDGELWFTALVPYPQDHGEVMAAETGYSRIVDGVSFEFITTRDGGTVYRNGEAYLQIPFGTRAVTDRKGQLKAIIGMSVRTIEGTVRYEGQEFSLVVKGNEQVELVNGQFTSVRDVGVIYPTYR